jgi:Phosphopantetheine attachment site
MRRDDVEHWLRQTVLELQDGLSTEQIVSSASFFEDLGFDSLAFERLVATIESTALNKDLTQWYLGAGRHGEDTFGSLLEFLLAGTEAKP